MVEHVLVEIAAPVLVGVLGVAGAVHEDDAGPFWRGRRLFRGTVRNREARLILGNDSLQFSWGTELLATRTDSINRIRFEGTGGDPTDVAIKLQVNDPAIPESEFAFEAEIPEVVALVRYLRQRCPAALK